VNVLCVVGTRPEAIKLAPVILELRTRPGIGCSVCVTGQHRELADDVLQLFAIRPDHDLDLMTDDQSMSSVAAGVLAGVDPLLRKLEPDWVVVQGDTTTTMAASLAAFHGGVPVAHVEAGLRTGDLDGPFPEELHRRFVTMTASLHLAPTAKAAANLRQEGVADADIVVTGNTVVDALLHAARLPFDPARTPLRDVPVDDGALVLLTVHRRESFGAPLRQVFGAVRDLVEDFGGAVRVVFPVHPNPAVRRDAEATLGRVDHVHLTPPLDYVSMVHVMRRSTLILTDSGGIQEEAPSLGVPVLVLRDLTERPEAAEAGFARIVGTDGPRILAEARRVIEDPSVREAMRGARNPYGDGHASRRVVDALGAAR
jgi:UDP-N-acetylglucosamine 2-epimerase (non-hydrolysing)